jgi:aminopeptidase YwaD
MAREELTGKVQEYLDELCVKIPSRRVGSAGNRAATDLFARITESFGWTTERHEFECMDWREEGVELAADGSTFEAHASPYSNGCRVRAPLAVIRTVDELEAAGISDKVALLCGEIAREPLMPKNFPFYNPDEHRRIVALLEDRRPKAIVTATPRSPEMAGAVYPVPMIEDGDFDIPSVYMTEEEGARLAEREGAHVEMESCAARLLSSSANVIARRGESADPRIVVVAHIDAKRGTPGATDNATGVSALLLVAEMLRNYSWRAAVELVAMNGEDYYSNPGEQQYLALNEGRWENIQLGINIDGVGYPKGGTAYSLYDCPPPIERASRRALEKVTGLLEGPPWYQGDHGLFMMNGRPALAITSEAALEMLAEITHTPKDSPELVDAEKVVRAARAVERIIVELNASG